MVQEGEVGIDQGLKLETPKSWEREKKEERKAKPETLDIKSDALLLLSLSLMMVV